VKLGVRGHEIEIPHFSLASSVAFPRELFRFSYTYRQSDKPISSVTIDLSDYSRRVSVTGKAAEQVEVISSLIENDLLRYSTAIGGVTFRRVVGVCLTAGLLILLGLSGAYWWRTRACNALGMLICSTIGLSLALIMAQISSRLCTLPELLPLPSHQICAADCFLRSCRESRWNPAIVFSSATESVITRRR
jgi:hypothetical protein